MSFRIMCAVQGCWTEILGHGCTTLEQAKNYVMLLPSLIVVEEGEELPECPQPEVDPRLAQLSSRTRQAILDAFKDLDD